MQSDTSTRQGQWSQTSKGRQFWPLDTRPGDFDIEEIAHALSLLCRFGGHCKQFYSVAEHSVRAALLPAASGYRLETLMHDASEAYLVDVPRPIKYAPEMRGYIEIEHRMEANIAAQFGLEYPWPKEVKDADNIILVTEARDIMLPHPAPWNLPYEPDPEVILPWPPQVAENTFLARYKSLLKDRVLYVAA